MARILDDELQNELVEPHCTLSDHTLPVTDIICGIGAFPACRVLTASVDHTVKVGVLFIGRTRWQTDFAVTVVLGPLVIITLVHVPLSQADIDARSGSH